MNINNQFHILKATKSNLVEVIDLLKALGLPSDGVKDHFQNFFVIKLKDKIVGCAGLEIYDEVGLLRSVAVAKVYQGTGLGKSLIQTLHKYSMEKKIKKIYLFTETAERFFAEKFGYVTIPRSEVDDRLQDSEEFKICETAPTMIKKF